MRPRSAPWASSQILAQMARRSATSKPYGVRTYRTTSGSCADTTVQLCARLRAAARRCEGGAYLGCGRRDLEDPRQLSEDAVQLAFLVALDLDVERFGRSDALVFRMRSGSLRKIRLNCW